MSYPTELVAKAKYELQIFERVSADTGRELVAEVERLREIISMSGQEHTHECIKCHFSYTPKPNASEDCPACGCNGQP